MTPVSVFVCIMSAAMPLWHRLPARLPSVELITTRIKTFVLSVFLVSLIFLAKGKAVNQGFQDILVLFFVMN